MVGLLSASIAEVLPFIEQIQKVLGVRIRHGDIVIHYNDGIVQRCETNIVRIAEVQGFADQILEVLDGRMRSGQIHVHFEGGNVKTCRANAVTHLRWLTRAAESP